MAKPGDLKRGTVVYSRNMTTGFRFVGVVLKAGYTEAQIQFCSSYDGLQNWPQTVMDYDHLEIVGQLPEWVEWNTCDV